MGGGGSGAPTSQTITQSNIPDWLRPQVETVLGGGMQQLFQYAPSTVTSTDPTTGQPVTTQTYDIQGVKPYIPYSASPEDYIAPFSPLQEQVMYNTANLQMPGQFMQGTDLAGAAGMGGLSAADQAAMYGGMGYGAGQVGQRVGLNALNAAAGLSGQLSDVAQMYGGQSAMAGPQYQAMATSPAAMQAYMNPYTSAVNQQLQRQADIQRSAAGAQAAQAGAYGGARAGLMNQQINAELMRQQAQQQAAAYGQAQQAMQYGAGLGLQGLQGAQQGIGQAINAAQMGLQGAGLGLQGTAQGMQGAGVGLQGVQGGLGGYGLAGQMAGQLGQLGTQQLAAQTGILGLQAQQGALQQQQQQNIINQAIQNYAQAQQYPLQQLGAYNALLRGYAIPGQTTTQYQAAPSLANQLVGLGGAAYMGSKLMGSREGGTVKMATGGIAALNDKVQYDPLKFSPQQIQNSVRDGVVDDEIGRIAIATINKAKMGLPGLPSNLPAQGYAPGGIVPSEAVAFEDGGEVERFQVGGAPEISLGEGYGSTGYGPTFGSVSQMLGAITEPEWKRAMRFREQGIEYVPPKGFDMRGMPLAAGTTAAAAAPGAAGPSAPTPTGDSGTPFSSQTMTGLSAVPGDVGQRPGVEALLGSSAPVPLDASALLAGMPKVAAPNVRFTKAAAVATPTLADLSSMVTRKSDEEITTARRAEEARLKAEQAPLLEGRKTRLEAREARQEKEEETSPMLAAMKGFLKTAQARGPLGSAIAAGGEEALNDYARSKAANQAARDKLEDARDAYDALQLNLAAGNRSEARANVMDLEQLQREYQRDKLTAAQAENSAKLALHGIDKRSAEHEQAQANNFNLQTAQMAQNAGHFNQSQYMAAVGLGLQSQNIVAQYGLNAARLYLSEQQAKIGGERLQLMLMEENRKAYKDFNDVKLQDPKIKKELKALDPTNRRLREYELWREYQGDVVPSAFQKRLAEQGAVNTAVTQAGDFSGQGMP